jgi:hypothetical protein
METDVLTQRPHRRRLKRAIPTDRCWAVLVHFDPLTEALIKRMASERKLGASPLVEKLVLAQIKMQEVQADALA